MIITGDCLSVLPTLAAESVQCVVTSPPYYGLRDYGVDGQIGLEKSPEEYVAKLVAVFQEVRRVLRDDGTVWLNLGDSYAGSGKGAWNRMDVQKEVYVPKPGGLEASMPKVPSGLKPKDMIGIPWMVAFALRSDGWYLRQDCIWSKPNCMPESVTDRCTKSHEYIFLLTKSARYFYDNEAVKEDSIDPESINGRRKRNPRLCDMQGDVKLKQNFDRLNGEIYEKKNRRSVWTITTKPFKEAHFATFPPEIPEICIKAGSKIGDTILDPFSGAGTTGLVAEQLNRKYIGIELNEKYIAMSENRIRAVELPLFQEWDE
jgi:DNA modification methylase